jgi:hypothetical protein
MYFHSVGMRRSARARPSQRLPAGFLLPAGTYSIPIAYANSLLPHSTAHHIHTTNYLHSGDTQQEASKRRFRNSRPPRTPDAPHSCRTATQGQSSPGQHGCRAHAAPRRRCWPFRPFAGRLSTASCTPTTSTATRARASTGRAAAAAARCCQRCHAHGGVTEDGHDDGSGRSVMSTLNNAPARHMHDIEQRRHHQRC